MIIIITNNVLLKDGECVGGYHEIHEIHNLMNPKHIIATVKSVVDNNLLFKDDDTTLTDVYVSFIDNNEKMEEEVINHFKENPFETIKVHKL